MIKYNVYRNDKMKDVDFYVTNTTDSEVIGYWLLRSSHNVMNREPDRLDKAKIDMADWKEVTLGKN